jgi:YebC/PmpR family DNA-binding regulatory protein
MAGHSHWANIARKKSVVDAKRGKLFSKLSRYIIIAARAGGGDPDTNLKLRYAIDKARAVSMPRENIERAIKRGTGELDGAVMEEITYEGFGAGNVAIICDVMTDNRNRTNGEVRKIFEKGGGVMAGPGSVAYLFERKGVIHVPANAISEDALMNLILEAGAEDMKTTPEGYEITTDVSSFTAVQQALEKAKITPSNAELAQVPKAWVDVDVETGKKVVKLIEALDDHDDINAVFCNANLTPEMYAEEE